VGADVWLVTGAQASGKSTVADLLARSFERGVHVRGGQFYRWVVRGWVPFDAPDTAAARSALDLRYRLSREVADTYAAAGFTCVVQDNIYGADVAAWLDALQAPAHLVVLRPSVATLERRDAARRAASGKVAYTASFTPADNDAHLAGTDHGLGLWLDTSDQTPEQTVREILARADTARVG
jgi:hypothetical protein